MIAPSRIPGPQGCIVDRDAGKRDASNSLRDYLLKSKQELDAISDFIARGTAVGRESRDWMLAQADFIVEAVGDENLELTDEIRSDLLQMLLAIANLNEEIRSRAAARGL